ncbi:MAG: tRNA (5-methylaminomethyl-2-thiouridine)(34)-methyltransferase MnmD [Bacteroidales bacterium]|nr:tRNA (5-methylaminomethyl-2-thiouridine)(34)-methyltransferase MnmD [Bacteroidales bacterium]
MAQSTVHRAQDIQQNPNQSNPVPCALSPELIITKTLDGSDTLFVPELNEHYHSTFGAVQESRYVYIEQGLMAVDAMIDPVSVFEVGFGTGLNTLLTDLTAKAQRREVRYTAIELYPIERTILESLNYTSFLSEPDANEKFMKIHEAPWEKAHQLNPHFRLTKLKADLRSFDTPESAFDVVYFDAFAPEVLPDLWTVGIFEKMFRMLRQEGILVTYSCKGIVKQNMKEAGFSIKRLPGPPGKWEMLRARKK